MLETIIDELNMEQGSALIIVAMDLSDNDDELDMKILSNLESDEVASDTLCQAARLLVGQMDSN